MKISDLKNMTEEQIVIEIEKICISELSDDDLVLLFDILEKYNNQKIVDFILLVREELRRRGIKRKIYRPASPGKKGGFVEEDY